MSNPVSISSDSVRNPGNSRRNLGNLLRHPGNPVRHPSNPVRNPGNRVRNPGNSVFRLLEWQEELPAVIVYTYYIQCVVKEQCVAACSVLYGNVKSRTEHLTSCGDQNTV